MSRFLYQTRKDVNSWEEEVKVKYIGDRQVEYRYSSIDF